MLYSDRDTVAFLDALSGDRYQLLSGYGGGADEAVDDEVEPSRAMAFRTDASPADSSQVRDRGDGPHRNPTDKTAGWNRPQHDRRYGVRAWPGASVPNTCRGMPQQRWAVQVRAGSRQVYETAMS